MEALAIITYISVLLLAGIIVSLLANKLKVPDVLMLILLGLAAAFVKYKGQALVEFPALFLATISILALALIVFDSSVRLRLRELDVHYMKSLKLVIVSSLFIFVFFSVISHIVLGVSLWLAVLFAVMVIGTSPEVVLPMLSEYKGTILNVLKLEALFNTPLTVVLPFLVIDFIQGAPTGVLPEFIDMLVPFLTKLVAGIGAGVFVGLILYKLTQKKYSPIYSPLAVIIAAMLTYVLSENLGGNGVLAVTTLGIFFGNIALKQAKPRAGLLSAESVLTKALFIFVFILVGMTIKIPLTADFFIRAGILFLSYLLIRFIAVALCFRDDDYPFRKKFFMTMVSPKGISTATVVFIFAIYNMPGTAYFIPGISIVLDMTLAFILFSIVISSVFAWQYKRFVRD
ncbi:cation:proton antiporter [Candidatus Woesearchaeota archaeon]|nr:cation:proton antiporter [Candidatus Woesearchaeota archaeon]